MTSFTASVCGILVAPILVSVVFAVLRRDDPNYGMSDALLPVAFGWAAGFACLAFTG